MTIDPDFQQGQSWKILSGGGYSEPHRTFVDEMWAAYRASFPDKHPPSRPTSLRARVVSSSQLDLSWAASTDNVAVSGYRISRNGKRIDTVQRTSYSSIELQPFKPYSYRVAAYDAAGNISMKSKEVTRTTQPLPSAKFVIGDPVRMIEKAKVRSNPSGSGGVLGTQSEGSPGTAVGGPWYWNSRWWWQIDFDDDGPDGWVPQRKLQKTAQPGNGFPDEDRACLP
jgi:hypothetical protein